MTAEESIDIDTLWDLRLAESIIAARVNANSV
jgi:CMP-N-acetylneuraminic acid synthetase